MKNWKTVVLSFVTYLLTNEYLITYLLEKLKDFVKQSPHFSTSDFQEFEKMADKIVLKMKS